MANEPKKKPTILGAMMFILLVAVVFRFVFEMNRPEPQVVTAAQKVPAVEEANTINNKNKENSTCWNS